MQQCPHDLDDGLDSGLLCEQKLAKEVKLWRLAARKVQRQHGTLPDERRWYFTIRCLIDREVRDVVKTSLSHIEDTGIRTVRDVRRQPQTLIQYSGELAKLNAELRDYLQDNLYYNPVVHEPNKRAVRMMEQLFQHFLESPEEMGQLARKRLRKVGRYRAVCDYIAGMTDRYVIQEHQRLFGLRL